MKTIEKKHGDDTTKWLSFWTVFGLFQTVEMFIGFILAYVPYYSIVRIVFFVYLQAPQTNGAQTLYKAVFQPFLKKHEKDIQAFVDSVQSKAAEAKAEMVNQAKEAASSENILKVAQATQDLQKNIQDAQPEKSESEKKDD